MKRLVIVLLAVALLMSGCRAAGQGATDAATEATETQDVQTYPALISAQTEEIPYESMFDSETVVALSDEGITVNGGGETEGVFTSHDIVYYEEKTAYESGYPYGAGSEKDMHTAQEAQAHTVVNITQPGAYRIRGSLSAGQIRVDLGEEACDDPQAVVELILEDVDITCTVAPAILFRNVYECDGDWAEETAQAVVDTSGAGANLVLIGENTVHGSYVAKIYKDKEGEKKLCKQDGAIYSYMSMNVYGPGALKLTAENEGLDTELHLTINGGNIAINAQDDGINTNEDGVSVTTINAGTLHIAAGLGSEGDGIDSNGFLVINGGTVISSANPASDAGLDSDMGSYINGGTVVALGSTMDWAESDSEQVTMNLQFATFQDGGAAIVVTQTDGTVAFAYDPSEDEVLEGNTRRYQGAIISSPNLIQGCSYHVYTDGAVTGEECNGVYDVLTITDYTGGNRMQYTGTDVGMGFGNMGGFPGGNMQKPDGMNGQMPNMEEGERPELPEGETMPADFDPTQMGGMGERPEKPDGQMPQEFDGQEMPTMPEGERPELPEGETMPADFDPTQMDGRQNPTGEGQTAGSDLFYMQDKVNAFSGLTAVSE